LAAGSWTTQQQPRRSTIKSQRRSFCGDALLGEPAWYKLPRSTASSGGGGAENPIYVPVSFGTVIGHYSTLIDRRTKYIRPLVYLIDRIYFEPTVSKISSEISGHRSKPDLESGTSMMQVKAT
jgi:hypothetical protein